ncbi:MAG: TonB-dependent receptor plug domain-containing protein [Acidobacteria bacterium]|nr:TonB-dependent receptor plug domain-containing protein [Acidobacteriota bacterium]
MSFDRCKVALGLSLALLFSLSLPDTLLGQAAITAKVVGAVSDPSGAAVPGATVTVRNTATNLTRTASTNETGSYEFSFLPIGTYELTVESAGFQTTAVESFNLAVDQVARVNVSLTIGEVSETVNVSADAVSLQTEDSTVGTVIDSQKVVELPLNGRSFVQLAQLTPGVNPGTPGSITVRRQRGSLGQSVGMSANGARDTQNRFYFDGIEAMDLDSYSFSFSPSIDAIDQFKVQASTYSAEVGGAPGGQVNLTTKSGSNNLHGGAWWFNRNDAFSAVPPFTPYSPDAKPPKLNRNQYGANVGGPVIKDKAFFFFNWEAGRQVAGQSVRTAFVPPTAYRTGDFSGSGVPIIDPTTGQQFANNIIPANRIKSYASTFLNQFTPAPNADASAFNFRAPSGSAPINQDQFIGRGDYRLSDTNNLYGSFMFNKQADDTVGLLTEWDQRRGNQAKGRNFSIADTQVFSPSIVNEARFGFHRFFEHEFFGTTDNSSLDIANLIGIPGVSTDPRNYGPPTFSTGYSLPSVRGIGPRDRSNDIYQFSDNVSLRFGNHFVKAGGMIARRYWTFDESVDPRGSFTFDGRTTSAGASALRENQFASFLLGLATSAQISVEPFATRMSNWWQGYYIQDDWKVKSNFTVNIGMRYEYFSIPHQDGPTANFDLGGSTPGFVASQQWLRDVPGYTDNLSGAPSKDMVNPDRNNFGPRIGFAWQPGFVKDFVVRGGYGIYYTPEITNSWTSLTLNAPIVNTYQFTGTFDNPLQVETAFTGQGQAQGRFGAFAVDPHLRDTYNQQWNFTMQKKLPAQVILDVAYVGSKANNLTTAFDANRPVTTITPGAGAPSVASRRPLAGFAGINTAKSIGRSNYHSLQVKAERRLAQGLSVLASYTYGKTLSNSDISTVGGGSFLGGIQNIYNLDAEFAPSAFDIRHRFSLATLYNIPTGPISNPVARRVLGGWQVGAIITMSTGFASSLSGVGDTTGTGVSSRVSVVPGQVGFPGHDSRSREQWFNTNAFFVTPLGQFGNASRMPIYLPGMDNVDLSAIKDIQIVEGHTLQFRAEFFNALNVVNLGAPGLSITAPQSFGVITTAAQGAAGVPNEARVIQFALKYRF